MTKRIHGPGRRHHEQPEYLVPLGLGTGIVGSIYDVTPSTAGYQTYPALERVSSYFGRVTYSFADRYTVTGTLRSDGRLQVHQLL